jgi:hypothetical protein
VTIIWSNHVEGGMRRNSLGWEPEQARAYVLREIEAGPQTFADLWAKAQREWPKAEGAYRAIDRALSYWKRGGVIEFDRGKGCWRKIA